MPSSESPTPQPVDAAAQAEILAQRPNLDTCPRCRRSYVRLFGLAPDHHWPVDAGEVIGHYCGLCCSFISGHGPTPRISAEVTATVAITQSDDAAGVGSSPAGEKRRSDFQCKKCGGTEYWVSYVPDGLPPTVAMCNACSPSERLPLSMPEGWSVAPDPASLGWRRLDADAQADFLRWAEDQLAGRLAIVEREYQSHIYGFQGDPLEHLIKEQLDGLFYSWQELRRRNAERNAIDDRGLLILWRLYCDDAGVAQSTADDLNRIDTFVAWLDEHCADAYNANLPALREAWQQFIIGNREFTVAS